MNQKAVVFLGNVANEDIGSIFSNALQVSQQANQKLGIANIESLREGSPVACTNTEGSKDIIVNGKNDLYRFI